jgi:hypothetical protein
MKDATDNGGDYVLFYHEPVELRNGRRHMGCLQTLLKVTDIY